MLSRLFLVHPVVTDHKALLSEKLSASGLVSEAGKREAASIVPQGGGRVNVIFSRVKGIRKRREEFRELIC